MTASNITSYPHHSTFIFNEHRQRLDTPFKPDFAFWPKARIKPVYIRTAKTILDNSKLILRQGDINLLQEPIGLRTRENIVKTEIDQMLAIVIMLTIFTTN